MNVTDQFSTGEAVFFWIVATLMVLAALGVAFSRKAVHSAVCMIGFMVGLAMIYVSQGAYFLGAVQVVVYTGAVMMLVLFVIMLVGVAASDNYRKTRLGLRVGAWVLGGVGAALLALTLIAAHLPEVGSVAGSARQSNPVQLALSLFTDHLFTIQVTATLLIIAEVGAIMLTHSDRLTKRFGQRETAVAKMLAYAKGRHHPGQLPAPGVYAQSNSPDVPALSGETHGPVELSVPRVLRARGQDRSIGEASPTAVAAARHDIRGDAAKGLHSIEASKAVGKSGAWGMSGPDVDHTLRQPGQREVVDRQEQAK